MWNDNINQYERIAWVNIMGIPVSLRSKNNLNAIASRIGKVVEVGDISIEDGDLSLAHIGIIVNTGQTINTELEIEYKETLCKCWVSQVLGSWSPKFVKDESVFVNLPEENMEDDGYENGVNDYEEITDEEVNIGNMNEQNSPEEGNMGNNLVNGEAKDMPVAGDGEDKSENRNDTTENSTGMENQATNEEGEILNDGTNFGGNWREVFAECIRTEETQEYRSPRYSVEGNNNNVTGGDSRVVNFQAGCKSYDGPRDNGMAGDNGVTGPSKKRSQRVKGINMGYE
ncbi:hypothetical protein Hanom_Chr12g01153891 [Helianthus anomalus]